HPCFRTGTRHVEPPRRQIETLNQERRRSCYPTPAKRVSPTELFRTLLFATRGVAGGAREKWAFRTCLVLSKLCCCKGLQDISFVTPPSPNQKTCNPAPENLKPTCRRCCSGPATETGRHRRDRNRLVSTCVLCGNGTVASQSRSRQALRNTLTS